MLALLPDLLAVAMQALAAQPAVTAIVGPRVYDRVPADPTWPLMVVTVVSHWEQSPHRGRGRVQVDCWGTGAGDTASAQAHVAARTVVAVSRDLRGVWPAGRVGNSGMALGPLSRPDQESGRARWIVDLYLETDA